MINISLKIKRGIERHHSDKAWEDYTEYLATSMQDGSMVMESPAINWGHKPTVDILLDLLAELGYDVRIEEKDEED